jgi:Zn-dependent M28 family amino/carboxypeptidase
LSDVRSPKFSANFNPEAAQKLFAASGRSFDSLLADAEAHKPLAGFPLNATLTASVVAREKAVTADNLIAVIPGSDRRLAREVVVLSAHLDHLGVGEPIKGDPVYHGAMDDASGVASVLEIARMLKAAHVRPRRTLEFAIVAGEEKGLLGSRYLAEHPVLPGARVVADVNLDMPLPLWPFGAVLAPGLEESNLADTVRKLAARRGVAVVADPYPDRNTFIRTDQYSFVRTGVPAIALKFGYRLGTPEAVIEKTWRSERYHSPADNIDQPMDLVAAADFDRFLKALLVEVANAPERPRWREDSFFRRYVRP